MNQKTTVLIGAALCSLFTLVNSALAQGTAFTYQGQLSIGGSPATGSYDLTFALFNNSSTNSGQVGVTLTNSGVGVTNGLFTVTLNFGPVFTGNAAWLAIGVRTNGGVGFTALNPLQALTPAPYALYAPNAGAASSANSVAASNIIGSIPLAQLPSQVVTNTETGVSLGGTFTGSLTGHVTGNAATATTASNVVSGLAITNAILYNAVITNSTVSGTGTGLTLGQSAPTVFGTAALTVTTSTGYTAIPGLTETITVPANSVIYISTCGGVATTSSANGYSEVIIEVSIDGGVSINGGYQRVMPLNNSAVVQAIQNWSISLSEILTPGNHTITIVAAGTGLGSTATVSGSNTSALQGALTVLVLKQ